MITALPVLWDVWVTNVAGVSINRALATAQGPTETGDSGTPDTEAGVDLRVVMDLLEATAGTSPQNAARQIPIWRTYGAAAALSPSDQAFEALWESYRLGWIDRVGGLWLAEVAASTRHWEEAEVAYARIDATNLLVHRAEMYLQASDSQSAVRQFLLAKKSLDATNARTFAKALLAGRPRSGIPAKDELASSPGKRVTTLYQIARGISSSGRPELAIPIFEEAMAAAAHDSPGALIEQSITLGLGLALARTLPSVHDAAPLQNSRRVSPNYNSFAFDEAEYGTVKPLVRIRALAFKGVALDRTAQSFLQSGRILALIGDVKQAENYLKVAIELDPLLADAYLLLGSWYEERGLTIQARKLYAAGAEAIPADARLADACAIAAYKTLPSTSALPLLEEASESDESDPYVFAYLGDSYAELGRLAEARDALQRGLVLFPGAEPLLERLMDLSRPEKA